MNVQLLTKDTYNKTMKGTVEPALEKIKVCGTFDSFDGKKIWYEYYKTENAKAAICLSHGFTESAEKYHEMFYYFLNEGYSVFAIDHRGHGRSFKNGSRIDVVNSDSFDDYIEDYRTFLDKIVIPNADGLPLYLYAHSMGGAIAILTLERYPQYFEKAFLNAPMVEFNAGVPTSLARIISKALVIAGKGSDGMVLTHGFDPNATYENSHDTSKERFEYYLAKRIENDDFKTSQPSARWVYNSSLVTAEINKQSNCDRIKAKILLVQAEKDTAVLNPAQDVFVSRVKTAQMVKFPGAKHEIFMADDKTLGAYLELLFNFFDN